MRSKYKKIQRLGVDEFRRLTGVMPKTFEEMVRSLLHAEEQMHCRGRPNALCIEDQLLLMLEYYREYRTFFHIAESYGVSESTAWRICRWVEDVLIKSGQFSLPGKKELVKSDVQYEVVLIDASESPIERPKKSGKVFGTEKTFKSAITRGKRSGTPSSHN